MLGLRRALPFLLALLVAPAAFAQVQDDFADGDFTTDPPWTGDTDRFTVVPFGADFALRSDGLAEPDTIALATASDVTAGRWTFTFRYEANLTNANGTRVYLVADTPELKGDVQGYYVQIGTNNSDEIRLYRQDGPADDRTEIGASDGPVVEGEEGTVFVEVLRDEAGGWRVNVDGTPVIDGVQDDTYTASTALGVWLKHSSANGAAFFWDDFLADPDFEVDFTPPVPLDVTVTDNGGTLLVQFDEELDPATVAPGAFSVDGDVGSPSAAEVVADGTVAQLTFAPAIPTGDYTLTITGVADLSGNVLDEATLDFSFEADTTPPDLVSATATSATRVDVVFSEPVVGCDVALYDLTPGIGQPQSIACPGDGSEYQLVLGAPLTGPETYTVTATEVADLNGNVQPETSASFFFGTFDTPDVREIVINEIMYDPPDDANDEYVELFNRTEAQTFDLSALTLSDDSGTPVAITDQPTALGPGEYAVLVRDPELFQQQFPDVPFIAVAGFPTLNNGGDTPTIRLSDTVIDAVPYEPSWGGTDASLERRDPAGPSTSASNFATSTDPQGGTPGAQNSVFEVDTTPPAPIDVTITDNGQTLTVFFDEPLNPATVVPGNFALDGGAPAVQNAGYDAENFSAVLTLAAPLDPGTYTLTINGVEDESGNATDGATIEVSFDPDLTPPALVTVSALDATTVAVTFSEAVDAASAGTPSNYSIDGGIGQPASVAVAPEGNPARVVLTLGMPLTGPQTYTLTATNIADLDGNVLDADSAPFFFGEGDAPEPRDLVVNEIMYDPPDATNDEYVELFNRSDRTFNLADFTLSDEANTTPITADPVFVLPGEYVALVRDPDLFQQQFPDVPFVAVDGFPGLNNSGDAVVVRYVPGGVTVDSVAFEPDWGGTDASLERRSADGPSNTASNWATSTDPRGGTPAAPNSVEPDTNPPALTDVEVAADGLTLTISFDEPLDAATVVPGAFSVEDGPAVAAADYLGDDDPAVALTLASAPAPGTYTVTVSGIADQLGNVLQGAQIDFTFNPDLTPPALVQAAALDATTIEALFSEAVDEETAGDPANYEVSGEIGAPASVEVAPDGDARRVLLTLATPLTAQQQYTLTARGIADLAGNELDEDEVAFFFGEGEVPVPGDLVVNEIMYDPPDLASNEYIELFNDSDKTLDLSSFTLSDRSNTVAVSASPRLVLPGEYAVLVNNPDAFAAAFPSAPFVEVENFPSLNNSGDAVVVAFEGEARVVTDSVAFEPSWGGTDASLERRSADGPSNTASNWATSTDPRGGTPAAPNSVEPDTNPPALTDVEVAADGLTLTISFDEPLDAATVVPGNFALSDGAPAITAADYLGDDDPAVRLTLADRLPGGDYTLTADGVADQLGNATMLATIDFSFTPDETSPALLRASALDATTVDVLFSEPVDGASAGDPMNYAIDNGIGQPMSVEVAPDGDADRVQLTLAMPLTEGTRYTLTVTGIADVVGNVLDEASTPFFFGEGEVPAPRDLVVNEIQFQSPLGNDGEYVELFNRSDANFDLSEFTLNDASSAPAPLSDAPFFLLPDQYVVLVANATVFAQTFPEAGPVLEVNGFPNLNSSGDAVVLRYLDTAVPIDSVQYEPGWGESDTAALERIDPAGPSNVFVNWASSEAEAGGTPGAPNSVLGEDTGAPAVVFAEQLDATTVRVTLTEPLDPATVEPTDFAIGGTVPDSVAVSAMEPTVDLFGNIDGTTVSVSDVADFVGNVLDGAEVSLAQLAPVGGLIVNEILFDPLGDPNDGRLDGTEYLEFYNASDVTLTLTRIQITDAPDENNAVRDIDLGGQLTGAAPFASLDPGQYAVAFADTSVFGDRFASPPSQSALADSSLIARLFPDVDFSDVLLLPVDRTSLSLTNTEDTIRLLRGDGVLVDSVAYSDDWHRPELDDASGVALERISPEGPSSEAGNWTSSLDPAGGTPGQPNSVFLLPGDTPPEPGLAISPSPFNAEIGTQISYTLAADAALVRVRIFDGAGRLVRTLEDAALGGSTQTGTLTWQGRDDDGQPLRIGIYIVFLEALDLNGGRTEAYKEVVVLARNL